ncbi:hypothetical protein H5410_012483 [Solanum commersonii]|uniref:Uncharacterized protein n=1 Tax=Solanum commersonii TaxID=4109 RepID=A0A9J6ASH4_SOLCO|nr:hypothetical protein H5410_012483 [Solanum commersonii]
MASKSSSRCITDQVGELDLIHCLDPQFNWRFCKTRRGKYPLGDSPSGSVSTTNVAELARTGQFL